MSAIDKLNLLKSYFQDRHITVKSYWLEQKLENNIDKNFEQIYLEWLEQDWNLVKHFSMPSLPQELNINMLNTKKKTFHGRYLLQVNHIIDISKPLPIGNQMVEKNEVENSDEDENENENENEENFANLFKKGKNTVNKKEQKTFHKGPRMLQLCLTDGHNDCIGIEYQPIPKLNEQMIGIKIMLIGPFDVYMGAILLHSFNITIVSDKTFNKNQTIVQTKANLQDDLLEIFADIEENIIDID